MRTGEAEFLELFIAFQPRILRYVARLVGDQDAEDVTQEIFVKAHRALGSFRGDANLSTWLYRIATNAALDRLRRPSFRRMADEEAPSGDPIASAEERADARNPWTGDAAPRVEQQVVRNEMNACIAGFVERLSASYRDVLVLSEFEGLRDGEIARVLGITPGAAKIRLHRARERLRHELETHCDPYWAEDNEFVCDLKGLGK